MGACGAWRISLERHLNQRLDDAERVQSLYYTDSPNERKTLRRRVERGILIEPYPRLFARAATWHESSPAIKTLYAVRGLQQQHPSWAFCSHTAATILGLSVPYALQREIHVTSGHVKSLKVARGIKSHVLGTRCIVREGKLRITPLEQTVLDCLCAAPFALGVAIADSAMRKYGLFRDGLLAEAEHTKGRRGIITARKVLAFADERAESGGESIARALMHELGFAAPQLQVEIELPYALGGPRRVDFLWILPDGSIIIGELDGKRKYTSDAETEGRTGIDTLLAERKRESRLTATRAAIVRFDFNDLRNPTRFAELLDSFGVPRAA